MSATMNNHSAVEVPAPPRANGLPENHNPPQAPSHDERPAPLGDRQPHTTGMPNARKGRGARNLILAIVVALMVVGLLLWQRSRAFGHLTATTVDMAVPTVSTVQSQAGPAQMEIKLPGNLTAYTEASIYARTNGYVKAWYTDIGAQVKAGQLMAELEAPDVDAELREATAGLAQARATLDIDQLNFDRSKDLLATKVVSQQEYDQSRTSLAAQQAAVQEGQANVQNLTVQQGFQRITAPFTGVVTRRDTDVGALINAGSMSSSAQELFHLARTDILRVFISVPEVYSPLVRLDTPAWLELDEAPGAKFQGKIAHIAGAIDPATRTLLTEVQVPNADGRLFPGRLCDRASDPQDQERSRDDPDQHRHLPFPRHAGGAVVDDSNVVHLKSITVGHDFGTSYEVTSGITSADRLVLNPSDSIADGEKVQVQNAPAGTVAK